MIVDKQIKLFRPQKPYIIKYIERIGIENVSLYSATTGIPLLVIYHFILEDFPEHATMCHQKIKELMEFYGKV